MQLLFIILFFIIKLTNEIVLNETHILNKDQILSRKRRYVAFPQGSSFSVSLCTTLGSIGNPNVDFLSWAINWGVAYDLPNETWAVEHANGFHHGKQTKPMIQRRYRRDLYNQIEVVIDNMGYNGRECILRALCESSKYFINRTGNMIEELLKIIFNFPKSDTPSREKRDIYEYDRALRHGRTISDCLMLYRCEFSLIDLAFGKYSKP